MWTIAIVIWCGALVFFKCTFYSWYFFFVLFAVLRFYLFARRYQIIMAMIMMRWKCMRVEHTCLKYLSDRRTFGNAIEQLPSFVVFFVHNLQDGSSFYSVFFCSTIINQTTFMWKSNAKYHSESVIFWIFSLNSQQNPTETIDPRTISLVSSITEIR